MNENKKNILSSSKILFTEYGYKRVSMDEIAKKSNVTKKTVYSYFKDKESLLLSLVEEELNNMKDIVDNNLPTIKENFFENFNNTLLKLLKYKKENKFLISLYKDVEYFSYQKY